MSLEILEMLVKIACADGVVSDEENHQLMEKAREFNISDLELRAMVQAELEKRSQSQELLSGFVSSPDVGKDTDNLSGFTENTDNQDLSGFQMSPDYEPAIHSQSGFNISSSGAFVQEEEKESNNRFFSNIALLSEQGAMSRVFKAKRHGKWVVVKRLRPEFVKSTQHTDLFYKEFTNTFELSHPNIIRLYDKGLDSEGPYYYMEYVDGRRLAQDIGEDGIIEGDLVKKIALEILSTLEYVHKRQIFHRDLKPDNILLTFRGDNVKLFDFGLAAADIFDDNLLKPGTPRYAAPEQKTEGTVSDGRTDLFAFGKIFAEMLSGLNPDEEKMKRRSQAAYDIVKQCTQNNPNKRYANAHEVVNAVEALTVKSLKPELSISDSTIDLGTIRVKKTTDFFVEVSNTGFDTLQWKAAKRSAEVTLLASRNSLQVKVRPVQKGEFSTKLMVVSNGGRKDIQVRALVVNPLVKWLLVSAAVVVLLVAIGFVLNFKSSLKSKEQAAWQFAKTEFTQSSFRYFTETYPKSEWKDSALYLESKIADRSEWESAQKTDSDQSYAAYLRRFPNGLYVDSAEYRVRHIAKRAGNKERQTWKLAKIQHSVDGYSNFLGKYPMGIFSEAAKMLIAELERGKVDDFVVVSDLSPERVVEGFVKDLGSTNFFSAYNRTKNKNWSSYESFSSPGEFGGVTKTIVKSVRLVSVKDTVATVFIDYLVFDTFNDDAGLKQYFRLKKMDGLWKIVSSKVDAKYEIGTQQ